VGDRPAIEPKDVDELVGRSRGANVFKIMDAVGDGQPSAALLILSELFEEGEEPLKLLGALGFQLRKLAKTARMYAQGVPLDEALSKAGIPNFPKARDGAKKQMKHLGRARLDKLYDWLLELDSGLKGGNPLPDRVQMERLIVRLARERAA
jgi:DNA polymerase-3 subunit delta